MSQIVFFVIETRPNLVDGRVVLSQSDRHDPFTLRYQFLAWWRQRIDRKPQNAPERESLDTEKGDSESKNRESANQNRDTDTTIVVVPSADPSIQIPDNTRAASLTGSPGPPNGELERPGDAHERADSGLNAPATHHGTSFGPQTQVNPPTALEQRPEKILPWHKNPAIYSAIAAAIMFTVVLVLQVFGLVKAAKAVTSLTGPPRVSWCSPIFQPLEIAAVDSNCNVYTIAQSKNRGIGCIRIPGVWQQQWITGTVVGTSFELVWEVVDMLILAFVHTTKDLTGAKLRRPWTTFFSGLTVPGVTLVIGIFYAYNIPQEMGKRVDIAVDFLGPGSYSGELTSAGLRGKQIGWSDGPFESWKGACYGNIVS
ncbi:MAG: hypothetical protein Q9164_005299 [Protoblastenia rupestris]